MLQDRRRPCVIVGLRTLCSPCTEDWLLMLAELFESRIKIMEAKEQSNAAHNAQLQQQLATTASRLKNTTKECNAQLQQIVELQKAVNEGEDKNAELRRELEEKNVELGKEVSSLRPCRS